MTEAQEFEGKWVLRGTEKGDVAVLVVARNGLRIMLGFHDEDNLRLLSSPPYLSEEALFHLRELTEDVWQCSDCLHWAKGEGYCPWCGVEHESSEN